MKRYDTCSDGNMLEKKGGDYVLFTDHEAGMKSFYAWHQIGWCGTHGYGKFNTDGCVVCQLKADHEAAIKKAVEGEREATICVMSDYLDMSSSIVQRLLIAIRSRGEKESNE